MLCKLLAVQQEIWYVHNVVAAAATVGLLGQEGLLIRKVLIPLTFYLIMAGIIGMIFLFYFKVITKFPLDVVLKTDPTSSG